MNKYTHDIPLWLFGLVAAACLIVSAPATYQLVALFHEPVHSATPETIAYAGLAATIALIAILEVGTVAAKLATLFVTGGRTELLLFCITGLIINGISNFITGLAVAATHHVDPWYAYPGAVVYAALVPGLAYLMLDLFVRRVEELRGRKSSIAERVERALAPVQEAAELFAGMQAVIARVNALQVEARPASAFPDTQNGYQVVATNGTSNGLGHSNRPRCRVCGEQFDSLRDLNEHRRFSCSQTAK